MDDEHLLKAIGANNPEKVDLYRTALKTSIGRAELLISMMKPAQAALDFVRFKIENKSVPPLTALKTIRLWNTRIWILQQCFDGTEEYDHTSVFSLVSNLRTLETSIVSDSKLTHSG